VIPEEEQFVTGSLIEATCMVGTQDQLLERLAALYDAGLDQVMILPAFAPRYENLERVGRELIPQLQRLR
jgi:alkanesulfonate monooxygenase SsuD/methylene tetrahydromethanopterin reductase-like flavin-dependent oxidoreductase (luciferase family)